MFDWWNIQAFTRVLPRQRRVTPRFVGGGFHFASDFFQYIAYVAPAKSAIRNFFAGLETIVNT